MPLLAFCISGYHAFCLLCQEVVTTSASAFSSLFFVYLHLLRISFLVSVSFYDKTGLKIFKIYRFAIFLSPHQLQFIKKVLLAIFVINLLTSSSFCQLLICPLAISDYKQSLQFQNLNEEKRNIHLEVCATTTL